MSAPEDTTQFYNAAASAITPTGKVLIIGSGPVGMRAAKEILKRSPMARVTLMGNEPYRPYNRVQLSSLLAKEITVSAIDFDLPPEAEHPNFEFIVATARRIESITKTVIDSDGFIHNFDQLIVATGSRPHQPNIPGVDQQGVFTFRNLRDAEALYGRTASSRRIVVIGGGLLGLESARALLKANTEIIVVQQAERLMNRQLDDTAAEMLQEQVEALGIEVITNSGVREIFGEGRVTGVALRDGKTIDCDTVLLCAGIQPNKEIAINSQIKVAKGITVDDQLQTSAEDVYAIGECCEHNGKIYGLVNPGFEQAAVVAENLCGGQSQYLGSPEVSRLKVVGTPVFSMGEVAEITDRPRQSSYSYSDSEKGIYRKVVVNKGRITGALSIGEWDQTRRIQESFLQQRYLPLWQILRFKITGDLWGNTNDSVAQWPDSTIICQCNGIEKGPLLDAIKEGSSTVAELSSATGAGTVCGSCKPLLAELTGSDEAQEKETASTPLTLISILALIAVIAIFSIPGASTSDSVINVGWYEKIWNDKFWKQTTGFTLLGLSIVGLVVSLRKRFKKIQFGNFAYWRMVHSVIGLLCVSILIFHTGLHLGSNLNQLLMINFLLVLIAGALAGSIISLSHKLSAKRSRKLRNFWTWFHILVTWPLPVLVATHIFTVYYF